LQPGCELAPERDQLGGEAKALSDYHYMKGATESIPNRPEPQVQHEVVAKTDERGKFEVPTTSYGDYEVRGAAWTAPVRNAAVAGA
jgi:hypothetical protein